MQNVSNVYHHGQALVRSCYSNQIASSALCKVKFNEVGHHVLYVMYVADIANGTHFVSQNETLLNHRLDDNMILQ
jgi:hypothetical protein